jgi:hypothetical protein
MTKQGVAGAFDLETLHGAIEESNAGTFAGLYAEDAELRVLNRKSPPGSPFVLRGREAISDYYENVCGRAMTHHIEREVVGEAGRRSTRSASTRTARASCARRCST